MPGILAAKSIGGRGAKKSFRAGRRGGPIIMPHPILGCRFKAYH